MKHHATTEHFRTGKPGVCKSLCDCISTDWAKANCIFYNELRGGQMQRVKSALRNGGDRGEQNCYTVAL